MKYQFKTEVRGYELDSYGHVNNAVYINYTEQARWKILQQTGLLDSLLTKGLLLVVTETNIRYMRELKLFDKIEIVTSVKFEAPYFVFDHDILNLNTELKAAKAQVKALLVDNERALQNIPEELLAITN